MSRVSSQLRRGFLQGVLWDAQEGGITLGNALKAVHRARFTDIVSGKPIQATSRSGHSVAVSVPEWTKGLGPTDMFELTSGLWTCYESAVTALGGADPESYSDNPDNNDAIFAYMVANCGGFKAVRSALTDFSGIRQEASFAA